uniref:Uncharacterized protein n=1 Tax=Rangifer tarandus platyrhynchus TaxID=3082113 RepID=A0ACB0DPM3_RANTA|nr:unnamed protein product [Rangifer tarandus platyrhynchus]
MHHDDQGQRPGPLLLATHRAGFLGQRLCCGSTQRCRVSPRITRLDPRVTCQLAHCYGVLGCRLLPVKSRFLIVRRDSDTYR